MKKLHLVPVLVVLGLFALAGCGGGGNMTAPPGTSPMSLTVTDDNPAGTSILSMEVTLTGAVLNPGSVDLLNGNTPRIEVEKLETEDAFLNTTKIKPGTFTSITLTFSNPEVTFMNGTPNMLAGCAPGAVCEIKPAGTLTTTFTFPGGGVMLGGTPSVLRIDINPGKALTMTMGVDFSAAGAVSVTQLTPPPGEQEDLDDLDELRGVIQNLDTTNKKFDLVTAHGIFHITTNANTVFQIGDEEQEDGIAGGCAANNFTCLANGMVVEVDVMLQPDGTFLAKKIEFEDVVEDDEVEGVVFKVDDASHFELVILEELREVPNVALGNPVKVTLATTPCTGCFQVKSDALTVPGALLTAFISATDTSQLIPGQAIEIRVKSVTPGAPIQITTDRVRLRMTQFTAKVSAAGSPNFTVNNLPVFFAPATSVLVETQAATQFENVAGASSLVVGDTVSLRGLLFSSGTPATPDLIAKKVRKRQP